MTDAHCHLPGGNAAVREFPCAAEAADLTAASFDFVGLHPWAASAWSDDFAARLRRRLADDPHLGVGEIGLDRLRERTVSPVMRRAFEEQLAIAAEFRRPVVLHGAKCWGQVVEAVRRLGTGCPAFLFHGFSRSDGLIPEIVRLNGFISVGPAVLNDHAVNYRELVRKIPAERLLVETDRTRENAATCPSVADVLAGMAKVIGVSVSDLELLTDANAAAFNSTAPRRIVV